MSASSSSSSSTPPPPVSSSSSHHLSSAFEQLNSNTTIVSAEYSFNEQCITGIVQTQPADSNTLCLEQEDEEAAIIQCGGGGAFGGEEEVVRKKKSSCHLHQQACQQQHDSTDDDEVAVVVVQTPNLQNKCSNFTGFYESQATTTTKAGGSTTTTVITSKKTTGVIRGYVASNPYELSRGVQVLLQFTEFPFLILWIFFAYFVVIVVLTAAKVRQLVWLNALVAGMLVGIGLNANAYHAIMYKGYVDIGMVIRFFLIPFGVSALSGLTNSLREDFMLVFPKNPRYLSIAVMAPAIAVVVLVSARALTLRAHKVPLTLRNLLLNGKVYT
eukprot:GHVS01055341.1.p1 GENE.GHVS01055341.1~~GHVS01055341.1.p1  ORF type:complete len:328 (+),score=96.79 GHVS01055341.1:282-1265(+)